jgi:pimeloyl-ACP methyl ester carboxylesterase
MEGAGWDSGTNLAYLKELVSYWQHDFDWRVQEAKLNQFAQFRTQITGLGVHFVHQRGKGPNPLPLLLTHGWPDSFYRFHKLIPLLTDPASHGGDPADAFDVIVPSLPGFGFSDHPAHPLTMEQTAELWVSLPRFPHLYLLIHLIYLLVAHFSVEDRICYETFIG